MTENLYVVVKPRESFVLFLSHGFATIEKSNI